MVPRNSRPGETGGEGFGQSIFDRLESLKLKLQNREEIHYSV